MNAGYFPQTTREEYSQIKAANFSTLKHFARSPAHALAAMQEPCEQTKALAFGEAVHAAVLEPVRFSAQWKCTPDFGDLRTKAGKEARAAWEQENIGCKFLSAEDAITIQRMRDSLVNHPLAAELINRKGDCEAAAVWEDSQTGALVKCLFDKRWERQDGTQVVIDLKTCQDASEAGFARAVAAYRYDLQAAIYTDGVSHLFSTTQVQFMFIAVEKKPPFGVGVYELTGDDLTKAWDEYQRYLAMYTQCKQTDVWPCYEPKLKTLVLPAWLYASDDESEITLAGEKL